MRIVSGIDAPLADEHVIGTEPPLTPSVSFWRRRLNPFTGRSLSDRALAAEQDTRAGVQRLRGQSVSAGVIAGLDVVAEAAAFGAAPADAMIQVLPGSGLTRAGEDVIVGTPRRMALAGLPVYARVDQLEAIASGAPAGGTSDASPVRGTTRSAPRTRRQPAQPDSVAAALEQHPRDLHRVVAHRDVAAPAQPEVPGLGQLAARASGNPAPVKLRRTA